MFIERALMMSQPDLGSVSSYFVTDIKSAHF